MTAWYNENDPYAAQWLRNLISAGEIAPGIVDERSIEDVLPTELIGYTQCHFFAGIGVWPYALRQAGWSDDRPVWTGSCPCQPYSAAGKGKGFADERHLWPAWFHLIEQREPSIIFGEQVEAAIKYGWIDLVQFDLEGIGYATGAVNLPAAGVGAPHIRQRLWFVADRLGNTQQQGLEGQCRDGDRSSEPGRIEADANRPASTTSTIMRAGPVNGFWRDADWLGCTDGKFRPVEPGSFPLANGITARVGRLRAFGNAITPQVAQQVITAYMMR